METARKWMHGMGFVVLTAIFWGTKGTVVMKPKSKAYFHCYNESSLIQLLYNGSMSYWPIISMCYNDLTTTYSFASAPENCIAFNIFLRK